MNINQHVTFRGRTASFESMREGGLSASAPNPPCAPTQSRKPKCAPRPRADFEGEAAVGLARRAAWGATQQRERKVGRGFRPRLAAWYSPHCLHMCARVLSVQEARGKLGHTPRAQECAGGSGGARRRRAAPRARAPARCYPRPRSPSAAPPRRSAPAAAAPAARAPAGQRGKAARGGGGLVVSLVGP